VSRVIKYQEDPGHSANSSINLRDHIIKAYPGYAKEEANGENNLPKMTFLKTMEFLNNAVSNFGAAGSELNLCDIQDWFNELSEKRVELIEAEDGPKEPYI